MTRPVDPPGLDLGRLRSFLDTAAPGLVKGSLEGHLIEGGRSNLTYDITDGQSHWIIRRPPLGHVLSTAHDMSREFRVLSALRPTVVPVPQTITLCMDSEVLGAPFYVMERVLGTVYRTAEQSAGLGPARAGALSYTLVDVLADLHFLEPGRVGLGDFGRPAGFLERQLRRWSQQLEASRSRPVPGLDELRDRLAAEVPNPAGASIVHGDYRLDNVLVDADDRITAVLDWEMATIGDPLTDLGLLLVYWDGLPMLPGGGAVTNAVTRTAGFPAGEELAARYAARHDVDLAGLRWYIGLGYFKLAVIIEGIHYRYTAGQTVGTGFDRIGELVPALVALGHEALAGGYE